MPTAILEAVIDIAPDWMMFGTYLGIPYPKLQAIGGPTDVGTCMLATLNKWITLKPQEATIHNLVSAVRGEIVVNEALAQSIEEYPWTHNKVFIQFVWSCIYTIIIVVLDFLLPDNNS